MDDPIKIIWKYKNNNRRIQYNTYIFVGPITSNIIKILEKISDLSLYNTWIKLTLDEIKILVDKYGKDWYTKFFNLYHINNTISLVRETNAQKKELIEKFGKEWVDKHIEERELIEKKLLYSYESLIKDEKTRKTIKKGRATAIVD